MTSPCLPQYNRLQRCDFVPYKSHSYQLFTLGVDGAVERNGLHRR
jgi:hypothetical protein